MKRFACLILIAIGGCGGSTPEPKTFDLGLAPPSAVLPAVRIASVRAVAPFESNDMMYRLAYRDAAEIAAFASTRWAATPAELFRKQMLRAAGDKTGKCILDIEIQEFTQVFSTKEASEARIELRAWLRGNATRAVNVVESNAGPDAVSGAAAIARASNRAIGDLGAWIAAQPDCR